MSRLLGSIFMIIGAFIVGCSTAHYCWMSQTCVLEKQIVEENT